MRAVIDANIATALLVDLAYSQNAHVEVGQARELIAPELILSEVANAFWKIGRTRSISMEHLNAAINFLPSLIDVTVPANEVIAEALAMAIALNHPVYDCQYLVVAKKHEAKFITADKKLFGLAEHVGVNVILVRPA
jgi:predicted nucleic acid-binding protein